jgi:hypothetical protein
MFSSVPLEHNALSRRMFLFSLVACLFIYSSEELILPIQAVAGCEILTEFSSAICCLARLRLADDRAKQLIDRTD